MGRRLSVAALLLLTNVAACASPVQSEAPTPVSETTPQPSRRLICTHMTEEDPSCTTVVDFAISDLPAEVQQAVTTVYVSQEECAIFFHTTSKVCWLIDIQTTAQGSYHSDIHQRSDGSFGRFAPTEQFSTPRPDESD